jgi:hypothetical protein
MFLQKYRNTENYESGITGKLADERYLSAKKILPKPVKLRPAGAQLYGFWFVLNYVYLIVISDVTAWQNRRNALACKCNWQFTTEDARIKFARIDCVIDA